MGICISSYAANVATAKLILQNGELQEFSYPVKVSYLLLKNPACFICNSDEMDFNAPLSAIDEARELQLDNLYFALPLSWLSHPLQAEEMVALAVTASSAWKKSCHPGGYKYLRRRSSVSPLFCSSENRMDCDKKRPSGDCCGVTRATSGDRGKDFKGKLSAIPE